MAHCGTNLIIRIFKLLHSVERIRYVYKKVFFSLLCNKAATEAAALSYQSLFLMSHDWTVPLPCCFPKHDVVALESLCVPSNNRIVLHWNCPISDIYPRSPSDYGNIQKVMHLTPLASQLLRGSLAAALIACDGFITLGL